MRPSVIYSKASELPLVEVTWEDAAANIEAESVLDHTGAPEFGRTMTCTDVGYLVRYTRKEVVLAQSRCITDNTIRSSNTIPLDMVDSIGYLEIKQCLTKAQLLTSLKSRKTTSSGTKPSTSPPGSSSTSASASPSTAPRSTTS